MAKYWIKNYSGQFVPAPWWVTFWKRSEAVWTVMFWFVFALLIREEFPWSSLVHEGAHVVAAWLTGSRAHIAGWTSAYIERQTPFSMMAGYYVAGLFLVAAVGFTAAKRWPRWITAFVFGSLVAQTWEVGRSYDYQRILGRWPQVYHELLAIHYGTIIAVSCIMVVVGIAYRKKSATK